MSEFNEYTNRWFDRLAVKGRCAELDALLCKVKLWPTKRNLQSVRNMVCNLTDKRLAQSILTTIQGVESRKFKREFRFTYHTYPKWGGQASTCGSLFSKLRQAIEYHNDRLAV